MFTIGSKHLHQLIPEYKKCGVKVINVPAVNEEFLQIELNKLLDNNIVKVFIPTDPTDSPFSVAFIKFKTSEARENCVNLHKENIFIFFRDIYQGPLIFMEYTGPEAMVDTNNPTTDRPVNFFITRDTEEHQLANEIGQLYITEHDPEKIKAKIELLKEIKLHTEKIKKLERNKKQLEDELSNEEDFVEQLKEKLKQ
jgi:hypothetical protein